LDFLTDAIPALFCMADVHKRGKALESVLNGLFGDL
jgi:hypothetical protein